MTKRELDRIAKRSGLAVEIRPDCIEIWADGDLVVYARLYVPANPYSWALIAGMMGNLKELIGIVTPRGAQLPAVDWGNNGKHITMASDSNTRSRSSSVDRQ